MREHLLSRRTFLGGGLAAAGSAFVPDIWADEARPLLAFGVITDVHIGGRSTAEARLETALRWLESHGAEAILCAGDITHAGRISQLQTFADTWYKVFPNGKASDGRKVEFMLSTGNHDADDSFWANATEETMRDQRLTYGTNPTRVLKELFDIDWSLVWKREIKGFTFIGSQWPSLNPDLVGYVSAHSSEFDPNLPFFHCQHEHPKGTCHGSYGSGFDNGASVTALSPYPNAVAFSGHSHCTIADERAIWQGAFTSIGAGCLHEGGLTFSMENCTAFWHASYQTKLQRSLNDDATMWGGDKDGGGFLFVEAFADHLVVHRRSTAFAEPMGPDWIVPVPAPGAGGKFDFAVRTATRSAPQFAADAQVVATLCPNGHALELPARSGESCVHVTFPAARPVRGARVFDYLVEVYDGSTCVASGVYGAAGFSWPEARADVPTECLFATSALPAGKSLVFAVTPRECFGRAGRTIRSAAFTI